MYCVYHIITCVNVEELIRKYETQRSIESFITTTPRTSPTTAGNGRRSGRCGNSNVTNADTGRRRDSTDSEFRDRSRSPISVDGRRRRSRSTLRRHESGFSSDDNNTDNTIPYHVPGQATKSGIDRDAEEFSDIDHEEEVGISSGPIEKTTTSPEKTKSSRGDIPENEIPEHDGLDCSMGERKHYGQRYKCSPWKVIAKHTGTKRTHYHIIYISTAKNWGHNSKLGKTIRQQEYKCSQITCVQCLLEYITSGPNRITLRQILTERDKNFAKCVAHSLGIDPKRQRDSYLTGAERGDNIFRSQSPTRANTDRRMDHCSAHADEDIYDIREAQRGFGERETPFNDPGAEPSTVHGERRLYIAERNPKYGKENRSLVLHLCENKAFDKGKASKLLLRTAEGCHAFYNRYFRERLVIALQISKTLVFQESTQQRFERAKQFELKNNPSAADFEVIYDGIESLEEVLKKNMINPYTFALKTRQHFYRELGKKNNLFFYGPPGTGKTSIMKTLVDCHYNYTTLTGLSPTSTFNFTSLLFRNACFMDECKLLDNHFESWKLLAGGQELATDVKFEDKQEITDCVLYTASNYAINAYLTITDSQEAIAQRTTQFNFFAPMEESIKLNPFIWEAFWKKYAMQISEDDVIVDVDTYN